MNTEELLKRLDEQHKAYLETFKLVHEALAQSVVNRPPPSPGLAPTSAPRQRRRSTVDADAIDLPLITIRSFPQQATSFTTGETDISDDDDELYVQDLLPSYQFDYEDLRDHLKKYAFNEEGRTLLEGVVGANGRLKSPELFPKCLDEASSHNSHYSIFDVGTDGTPLSRHKYVSSGSTIDSAIWQAIQVGNFNTPYYTEKQSQRPKIWLYIFMIGYGCFCCRQSVTGYHFFRICSALSDFIRNFQPPTIEVQSIIQIRSFYIRNI